MSGHSHWAGIKYKKAVNDARRGKICNPLFPADKVVKAMAGSRQFIIHLVFTLALPAFPAGLA